MSKKDALSGLLRKEVESMNEKEVSKFREKLGQELPKFLKEKAAESRENQGGNGDDQK